MNAFTGEHKRGIKAILLRKIIIGGGGDLSES